MGVETKNFVKSVGLGEFNLRNLMRKSYIRNADELSGLSATAVASLRAQVRYHEAADFPLAELYHRSARYFEIERSYQAKFPDCNDTLEMGAYVSAREQILLERTLAALENGSVNNVVILASGLSPVAAYLRKIANQKFSGKEIKILCTDLIEPLSLQEQLCRNIFGVHQVPGIEFEELNVLHKRDWKRLESQLVPGGVAVICEGLLGYFTFKNIERFFENLTNVLARQGGFLVGDIATRDGVRRTLLSGDSAKLLRSFYEVAKVDPEKLAFNNSGECEEYLTSKGVHANRVALARPDLMYIPPSVKGEQRQKLQDIVGRRMCIDVRVS